MVEIAGVAVNPSHAGSQWGWVGERTVWETFSRSDLRTIQAAYPEAPTQGLTRDLDPGATYTPPPPLARPFPSWVVVSRSSTGWVRYALPLPIREPFELFSLSKLVEKLHAERAADRLTKTSQALDDLDQIAYALIDWVAGLHRAEQSAGLLTPEGVFWYREPTPDGAERLTLVPVDWGFECSRAGAKPIWFSREARGQPYWNADPAKMCELPVDRQRDWRTLARVFDWVMTRVPGGLLSTSDCHPRLDKDTRHPAFGILERVFREKATKPADLKDGLSSVGSRLSEFFLVPPPPPPPAPPVWRRPRYQIAAVAAILAVAACVYLFVPPPPPPPPYCADCPKDSPLYRLLFEFEAAVKAKDGGKKLRVYEEMAAAQQTSTGSRAGIEQECLGKLLPEVLPPTGCPQGSALARPLGKLSEALKREEKTEFTDLDRLDQIVGLLDEVRAAARSPAAEVSARETELYRAGCRATSAVFHKTGGGSRFKEYCQSQSLDFERVAQPAFRRFARLWTRFQSLCPQDMEEARPWDQETEDWSK